MSQHNLRVAVIGAGPAGLMAAEILSHAAVDVDVFDAMPSVGRKFLMAGKGGMNITHAEDLPDFMSRYSQGGEQLAGYIQDFTPTDLRQWLSDLGISTFIGTSGRVFPVEMKAAPLLRSWLHRLRAAGVKFHMRHYWQAWRLEKNWSLDFTTPAGVISQEFDAVVLALGGASWPKLGSTGAWTAYLANAGVDVAPLKPSNCGFDVNWSAYFKTKFAGTPLKSVGLSYLSATGQLNAKQGELMVTETGIEGGLIYGFSHGLIEDIERLGYVTIYVDLLPQLSLQALAVKLSKPRGKSSFANYLRKQLGFDGLKIALLREVLESTDLTSSEKLSATIKNLPLRLEAPRPIAEAISSAGGVAFEALDAHLMLKALPGVFCAGEMLNWDAPTGGYLLTACFATGRAAAVGVLHRFGITHGLY